MVWCDLGLNPGLPNLYIYIYIYINRIWNYITNKCWYTIKHNQINLKYSVTHIHSFSFLKLGMNECVCMFIRTFLHKECYFIFFFFSNHMIHFIIITPACLKDLSKHYIVFFPSADLSYFVIIFCHLSDF